MGFLLILISDILRLELVGEKKNPSFHSDSECKLANLTYFHAGGGRGWYMCVKRSARNV